MGKAELKRLLLQLYDEASASTASRAALATRLALRQLDDAAIIDGNAKLTRERNARELARLDDERTLAPLRRRASSAGVAFTKSDTRDALVRKIALAEALVVNEDEIAKHRAERAAAGCIDGEPPRLASGKLSIAGALHDKLLALAVRTGCPDVAAIAPHALRHLRANYLYWIVGESSARDDAVRSFQYYMLHAVDHWLGDHSRCLARDKRDAAHQQGTLESVAARAAAPAVRVIMQGIAAHYVDDDLRDVSPQCGLQNTRRRQHRRRRHACCVRRSWWPCIERENTRSRRRAWRNRSVKRVRVHAGASDRDLLWIPMEVERPTTTTTSSFARRRATPPPLWRRRRRCCPQRSGRRFRT